MNTRFYSGLFFLLFSAICVLATGFYIRDAFYKTGIPDAEGLLKGSWTSRFEKNFSEALPVFEPSRILWGRAEYALFQQGRKGVVIGRNGWLFTDEEFSCPVTAEKNMRDHFDFIADVQKKLAQKDISLAVLLIPAKSRIQQEHLGNTVMPACRGQVYARVQDYLAAQGVITADLAQAMLSAPDKENLYLKTDTHWTPEGARLSAQRLAKKTVDLLLGQDKFTTTRSDTMTHEGDLMRYVPGIGHKTIAPDKINTYVTRKEGGDTGLFDDAIPPVTLVGTSYSANPSWNFDGFLKENLKTDVLNMADEGLGPFTVMDKYLDDDAWRNTPPRLVIWEIPERYMFMPHDINRDGKAQTSNEVF